MNCARLGLFLVTTILYSFVRVEGFSGYVTLTNDGPSVQGGRIVFRADLYESDGSRPSGTYFYEWRDNAFASVPYESPATSNTTSYWVVDYPPDRYPVGIYEVQVVVSRKIFIVWSPITSRRADFQITTLLNGNMSMAQGNKTLTKEFVASGLNTKINVTLRDGDNFYVKNNLSKASTYWFVDCKYYGMTEDFSFDYKFTKPDEVYTVEALVIASHEEPTTTTVAPTTTTTTTTLPPTKTTTVVPITISAKTPTPKNTTMAAPTLNTITSKLSSTSFVNSTIALPSTLSSTQTSSFIETTIGPTVAPKNVKTTTVPNVTTHENGELFGNVTFPFVCLNSSIIPPDPKKTYGYFHRQVKVRAPITNITVDGTNWIQPWDMLSLKVACHGSGPFTRCLNFHRGQYNVTGNETCKEGIFLPTCNFSIVHYFLEPSVYTIVVILDNEVSKQVYPVTINIYNVKTQPQLSVIVVPVSCSLVAVVLIIFGVAYYIQSRARFTIEVADFDFGQNNPEMEYKTFTERLRDSFNNTGYKQLNNPGGSTGGEQWTGVRESGNRLDP
ncbi:uncharacterized protein [Venturia canescens]|uniref:uncharacterized protein isoform X2 n=1 Tax=Venturia canescens TaxID=32260 RepID=UPI001C9CD9A4|nr:uncharacterized protein LOC122414022 isoform X2 [Venturia canescens]